MENHSSVTGCKSCFSYTNPSNFRRPLKSLFLRYMAENLHVSNFNMLFQLVPLPEIRVTDQISSTLNFKNGGPRIQRIIWNKIQNVNYLACREKRPSSLHLNRTITVSEFS